jgi:uncharacterized membrane protein (DUF106 family)
MNDVVVTILSWLNAIAGVLARILLEPIAWLPGWLSATLVASVTGVLLLVAFKYTSNQLAIKRARNAINANLLAAKLFKDNMSAVLKAQGGVFMGAVRLMALSIVPMLIMAIPVTLFMTQLSLWYQARPLGVGEEALLAVRLGGNADSPPPEVTLQPSEAIDVTLGPANMSDRTVYWNVVGKTPGTWTLAFQAGETAAEKEIAVGDDFRRVSIKRPARDWEELVLHPWEAPFARESIVQAIEIDYPERTGWTSGTNNWIIFWFIASMVAAFVFKPLLNVNI